MAENTTFLYWWEIWSRMPINTKIRSGWSSYIKWLSVCLWLWESFQIGQTSIDSVWKVAKCNCCAISIVVWLYSALEKREKLSIHVQHMNNNLRLATCYTKRCQVNSVQNMQGMCGSRAGVHTYLQLYVFLSAWHAANPAFDS